MTAMIHHVNVYWLFFLNENTYREEMSFKTESSNVILYVKQG
jgi:hypothetical protein